MTNDFNTLIRQRHFIDWFLAMKANDFQSTRGVGSQPPKRTKSQCYSPKIFYTAKLARNTEDQSERIALSIALAVLKTPQLCDLPSGNTQPHHEVTGAEKRVYELGQKLFITSGKIADSCRFRRLKIPDLVTQLSATISELQTLYCVGGLAC